MVSVFWHVNLREKLRGWVKTSDIEKGRFASNKRPVLSPEKKKITEFNHQNSSLLAAWSESFLFAGSSALLLLVANILPCYWYFSLFALAPFLYRISKATPIESLRLGILFGISFFGVYVTDSLPISPIPSLFKLLLGTGIFGVFGWAVGWARKRWGFYPSIIAVLWVGLEIGMMKLGFASGLLGNGENSNPFFHGLAGLLGFLMVSAMIVLLNSLLILEIFKTLETTKAQGNVAEDIKRKWLLFFMHDFSTKRACTVPEGRAPPIAVVNYVY